MREGQRSSLWTFAITDRFCSEPPTFSRRSHMPVAYWKDTISGVNVSLGSAETLVRRGGIINHHSIPYSLSNISAKNYRNRLMWVESIVRNISVVFLGHSVDITGYSTLPSPPRITWNMCSCGSVDRHTHTQHDRQMSPSATIPSLLAKWCGEGNDTDEQIIDEQVVNIDWRVKFRHSVQQLSYITEGLITVAL